MVTHAILVTPLPFQQLVSHNLQQVEPGPKGKSSNFKLWDPSIFIHSIKRKDKLEFIHEFEFEVITGHHLFSSRGKTQNKGKTWRYRFQVGMLGKQGF